MSAVEATSAAAGEPRVPWGGRGMERAALLALVVGMLVSLVWLVHPWYNPTNDGSMYIETARSFLRGEGITYNGAPFLIRPPGFPVLLAPILAWRGTDFHALNLFVSLWGILGIVFLYLFTRARLGWGLAWLVCLAVWLNPGYLRLCNQTMSEMPGTALLVGALLLAARIERRPGGAWRDLLLGVAIGLSAYVRSVNVLLVPALIVARLLRRLFGGTRESDGDRKRTLSFARMGLLVLGLALTQLPWSLYKRAAAPPPPADHTLLYSYGTGMFNRDMGDPDSERKTLDEILGVFPKRCSQIALVWGSRLFVTGDGENSPLSTGITIFFLSSVVYVFFKRRDASEIFLLGSLVVISVYFGFAARLLLPHFMLGLPAAAELVRDVFGLVGGRRVGVTVAGLALLFLVWVDFDPHRRWARIAERHRVLSELARRFEEKLEPDAVLASDRGWHYAVYLDRRVYSLRFARDRGTFREMEAMIDRYGINTIVASPAWPDDVGTLRYCDRRYGEGSGLARVYRVRP